MHSGFVYSKYPLHLCAMNERTTLEKDKSHALLLYTQHGSTLIEIAHAVSTTEDEVRQWVADGNWEERRCAHLTAKATQQKHLLAALDNLTRKTREEGTTQPKDMDMILKYTAAIKNLEPELSIGRVIEVADLFITWLRQRSIPFTQTVIVELDAFIKHRIEVANRSH